MDPPRDAKAAAPREPVAEPAALPWGMDKTDVQKSSLTELTDEKLARFVIGQQKKTKYEKEREEREIKKRKADEEAAAMYAKFVASFEDEDETMGKAFVRSGDGSGDLYRLQATGTKKKLSEMDRLVGEMKQKQQEASGAAPPPQKKRREMDLMVEEIKNRESSAPVRDEVTPMTTGSFDHGDPDTTNLYVGNLAPSVTEEKLERVFGKFGRIYSIKVMWPRSEEERSRGRMSGFVSFFTRREADDARVHLHDSELDGQGIVVGWGKAVKIEPNAAAFSALPATPGLLPVPTPRTATSVAPNDPRKIIVRVPSDESTRRRIDHLAAYVAKDGLAFENAVRLREASNPLFAFLSSEGPILSPDTVYYRWRVFAFAMGDTETAWRDAPFQMTTHGPVWVPPPQPPRPTSSRDAVDSRHDRRQDRQAQSHSRSQSRSHSRSRGHRDRRRSHSRSRSRSRRSRSRSHSRDRRRRSRSRSYSSSSTGSDRSRPRRRRSHSRSRSRSPSRSRSSRRSDGGRHRDRGYDSDRDRRRRSRSRSRSPLARRPHRATAEDDALLKKDETMLTGQQLARARDLERGNERNRLPRDAFDHFMALLDALTLERESVKQAMGCALDNSECAVELVHLLRERFQDGNGDASPVQLVAYLYVASDILHNSSAAVKNASLFRTTFQECLPEILDALRRVHRRIQGRMSALAMRDKVLAVLTAWGSWSLFPPHYLVGLNATFMRKVEEVEYLAGQAPEEEEHGAAMDEEKLRKACSQAGILSSGSVREMVARLRWLKEFTAPTKTTKPSMARVEPPQPVQQEGPIQIDQSKDTGGVEKDHGKGDKEGDVDGKAVQDDDLDGEPLEADEEDLDGEPLDGVEEAADEEDLDGAPMDDDEEDIDGAPMDDVEEEEDVDGEPLDEDLDGEPL